MPEVVCYEHSGISTLHTLIHERRANMGGV